MEAPSGQIQRPSSGLPRGPTRTAGDVLQRRHLRVRHRRHRCCRRGLPRLRRPGPVLRQRWHQARLGLQADGVRAQLPGLQHDRFEARSTTTRAWCRSAASRIAPRSWRRSCRIDNDPYPVALDGRVLWIIDAYTTSDRYPYAESGDRTQLNAGSGLDHPFNYVRNSIKVVVDAYNGTVDFYIIDPTRSDCQGVAVGVSRSVQVAGSDAQGSRCALPVSRGVVPGADVGVLQVSAQPRGVLRAHRCMVGSAGTDLPAAGRECHRHDQQRRSGVDWSEGRPGNGVGHGAFRSVLLDAAISR